MFSLKNLVKSALSCLAACALFGWGAGPAFAEEYYVAPNGDDSNSGSADAPWRSPGYASRRLEPGDTLIIRYGRYVLSRYDEDILQPPSGSAGKWITIRGEKPGRRPVLAGRENLICAIDISGADYVRVENLEICSDASAGGKRRWFREGVSNVGEPSRHVVLRNLRIHHLDEMGVDLQDVDDIEIVDCRIEYCGFGSIGGPEGEEGGWRNVVIRDCRLSFGGHYYQGGDGSERPYDRPDGLGNEASAGPISIVDTVAEHNRGDGLDSKSRNVTIERCLVANNSCDGIKLWGGGSAVRNTLVYGCGDGVGGASPWAGLVIGTRERGAEFEVVNLTLHDNAQRRAYPLYVQYDDRDIDIEVTMRNCIVAGGYGVAYFGPSVELTADHNLFHRPGGGEQVEANGRTYSAGQLGQLGEGNVYGDPEFVRPAWGKPGDYMLRKGSPALDAGTDPLQGADIDGDPRVFGAAVDLGAHERRAGDRALRRPRLLTAKAKGRKRIELSWKDRSGGACGHALERRGGLGEDWIEIALMEVGITSYVDRGLTQGETYNYRVRAVTFARSSLYSKAVTVKTGN